MKRLFTFSLFMLLMMSLAASGFSLGLESGYDHTLLQAGKQAHEGRYWTGGEGGHLGLLIQYRSDSFWGIETGIEYQGIGRNYKFVFPDPESGLDLTTHYGNFLEHYIALPLLFTLQAGLGKDAGVSFFIAAGGYLGFWIIHQQTGGEITIDDNFASMLEKPVGILEFTSSDERFNAGLILKTGFCYDLGKYGQLQLAVRYRRSLMSIASGSQKNATDIYLDSIGAAVGYTVQIGGGK